MFNRLGRFCSNTIYFASLSNGKPLWFMRKWLQAKEQQNKYYASKIEYWIANTMAQTQTQGLKNDSSGLVGVIIKRDVLKWITALLYWRKQMWMLMISPHPSNELFERTPSRIHISGWAKYYFCALCLNPCGHLWFKCHGNQFTFHLENQRLRTVCVSNLYL